MGKNSKAKAVQSATSSSAGDGAPATISAIADEISNRIAEHRIKYEEELAAFEAVLEDIVECTKVAEAKQANWNRLTALMTDNYAKAESTVKLNVRGKVFETFKENLVREEGTYFHAMVCSGAWKPNPDGNDLCARVDTYKRICACRCVLHRSQIGGVRQNP